MIQFRQTYFSALLLGVLFLCLLPARAQLSLPTKVRCFFGSGGITVRVATTTPIFDNPAMVGRYIEVPGALNVLPGMYKIRGVGPHGVGGSYADVNNNLNEAMVFPTPVSFIGVIREAKPAPSVVHQVFDGDSFVNFGLARAFDCLLPFAKVYERGQSGQTMATIRAGFDGYIDPLLLYPDTLPFEVSILCGTNSLYFGVTPEDLLAQAQEFVLHARAKPRVTKVRISTVTPRSHTGVPAGFEAARLSYNALLRAWVASLGDPSIEVLDYGASPILGYSGAELTDNYEQGGDRAHPRLIKPTHWTRPFITQFAGR